MGKPYVQPCKRGQCWMCSSGSVTGNGSAQVESLRKKTEPKIVYARRIG